MEDSRYTVILNYDPQNAEIHQKVVACLTRLDPQASKHFEKAEFTGRLILKRKTDPATARRLQQLLDITGAACELHKVPEESAPGMEEDQNAGGPPTAADRQTDPQLIQCPKCGCEQPANPECRACGVIIAKARRHQPSPDDEKPDAAPAIDLVSDGFLNRARQWTSPMLALIKKIQHPIDIRKLTTWTKRVADRLIRCSIVFAIALLLEIGLLALGKMLWSLYVATAMGKYYVERLPEQAQMFQCIAEADPLTLGLDVTLVVFCLSLLVACVAQILHLIRYLYESQGILGKLILWFIPCMGLTAWFISQRHPYPELALAGTLAAVPTLCMLSSCLYLARIVLPELGDLRVVVSIIMRNRDAAWGLIIKKIRIWFDATKRAC